MIGPPRVKPNWFCRSLFNWWQPPELKIAGRVASGGIGRSENAASVEFVVAEVFVGRSVKSVGTAFGDDVDDATDRASELDAVAGVDDTEFANRFLRRSVLLNAGSGRDVVCAIDGDEVVVDILSGEGEFRDRLDDDVGRTGGRVADLHAGSEQGEVDELASIDGQDLESFARR